MALIDLHGITIPDEAVVLGCQLERRGYVFSRQGDKLNLSRPKSGHETDNADTLSDDDRQKIAKYKLHLLAVVDLIDTTTGGVPSVK